MTPELKTACELVFQEHKVAAQPVKWDRDAFRGRISAGLSEMARETLVRKNIILPNKAKKVFTQLNPDVATADSFEEAEHLIEVKTPGIATAPAYNAEQYLTEHVFGFSQSAPVATSLVRSVRANWYLKPVFIYFLWPVCGAVAGVLISRLMDLAFTNLFLNR
jgi:hypothetical protein